jgi:death-on-curing protein
MAGPVRYLTADQVLALHDKALTIGNGGGEGLRSEHLLMSAVFQPQQTFADQDLYPTIAEKAAAYAFCLAENQPFVDGNKRTAAFALTVFLDLNGYELWEGEDEELAVILEDLGKGTIDQGEFFGWVVNHARPIPTGTA